MRLEDVTAGCSLVGLEPATVVTVAATVPIGPGAIQVFYRTPDGAVRERMLNRADKATLAIASVLVL